MHAISNKETDTISREFDIFYQKALLSTDYGMEFFCLWRDICHDYIKKGNKSGDEEKDKYIMKLLEIYERIIEKIENNGQDLQQIINSCLSLHKTINHEYSRYWIEPVGVLAPENTVEKVRVDFVHKSKHPEIGEATRKKLTHCLTRENKELQNELEKQVNKYMSTGENTTSPCKAVVVSTEDEATVFEIKWKMDEIDRPLFSTF